MVLQDGEKFQKIRAITKKRKVSFQIKQRRKADSHYGGGLFSPELREKLESYRWRINNGIQFNDIFVGISAHRVYTG